MNKIVALTCMPLLFTSCFNIDDDCLFCNDCYDGRIETKTIELATFHKLDLSVNADVIIVDGDKQKITLRGREDLIEDIEKRSTLTNDTWHVRNKNFCPIDRSDLTITITIPNLRELHIDGNGRIESESRLTNIAQNIDLSIDGSGKMEILFDKAKSLSAYIDGSGDMDLNGEVENLDIEIDGNGDIRAEGISAQNCNARIDGSGDVIVDVEEDLYVVINGSGTVCYKSNPNIVKKIDGSGRVKNCN
jgi:hypothetical protein